MSKTVVKTIHLVGLSLKKKTINTNGQSGIDCGNLWQEFEKGDYAALIPNKLADEIYGVYHQYDGDSTQPFSYFVGCSVKAGNAVPQGLDSLTIPEGTFEKITVKGKMPDCVINGWKAIWAADYARAYQTDFEVYDERSRDWNDAVVDVYVSVKS